MKFKALFFYLTFFSTLVAEAADFRYVGGDISLLPTYEEAGVIYNDPEGNQIDLLPYLYDLGMNAMRVRLFVNPENYPGDKDENACQDLPYILPLCKKIVDNGFDLMLDFHYSDTWADPGAQWIPEAWKDLSDDELIVKVYEYTAETLLTLKENGVIPKFIQPGNEISYGMLWAPYGKDAENNKVWEGSSEESWKRFGDFLASAIKACREVCPDTEIIIHTERVAQVDVLSNFYQQMKTLDIDYDIIGLSYYPSYHGTLSMLNSALTTLETQFADKPVMIVETGFPLYWDIPGKDNYPLEYPISEAGQNKYAEDLVKVLLSHSNVNGLFWWWLDYNPYGASLENWWNAPLFDPYTGKATPALKSLCRFGSGHSALESIEESQPGNENDRWYDLNGRQIRKPSAPGIYIHNNTKVLVSGTR